MALLREELRQGGRVFLLAYRRFGKSCLAQEGGAFYRFGRLIELAPVAEEHWARYLTPRFRRGSIDVTPGVVRASSRARRASRTT